MSTVEGKKQEKRRALLDAAYELFLERGTSKTSVEDITSRAKVGKGTFYLYFADKGSVTQALLARVLLRLTARRGQFPFLPEMGSRLYLLGRERPSAREALALQYVTEALVQEADLAVLGTELQEDGTGAAVLTANLEWRGTPLAVQVDVIL